MGNRLAHRHVALLLAAAVLLSVSWTVSRAEGSGPGIVRPAPSAIPSGFVDRGVVIDVGPSGSADSVYARLPSVVRESNGTYKMWYSGFDGSRNRILYASSIDGRSWTKHGVVIDVRQAPWYFDSVAAQSVLKISGTYHMWFGGGYWNAPPAGTVQIYHATSADGVVWTVGGTALPRGISGSWDSLSVHFPAVAQDSAGTFRLYFSGWNGSRYGIGVARSATFENFTEERGNPIMSPGTPSSFDSSWMVPNTVLMAGAWTMYYSGSNGTTASVGVATSADGLAWSKSRANPVMTAAPPPAWNSASIDFAAYLADPTGNRIYYDGSNGTNERIGLLTEVPSSTGGYTNWALVLVLAIVGGSGLAFGFAILLLLRRPSGRPPQ